MTQRSYLSIGDVLSLLREEFPDVTISKIRFLESQGLVDPERSPSGYRKFYEHDVARLRWVLRAQRDQFLPLKVIRDRLAAAGNGVPPDDDWPEAEPRAETGATRVSADVGARGAHAREARGGNSHPHVSPSTSSRASDEAADETSPAPAVPVEPAPPEAEPRPARHVAAAQEAQRQAARVGERRAPVGETPPDAPPATAVPGRGGVLAPSLSGVSLTLAELCAATGLATHNVAALEGLGLITPIAVAGGAFYDEEALMVGKLAAEFARFGIEPRHLRLYRNAVDREMGLVEQVVTPLLRQRNPEARQRAVETASELATLGQNLRASLVRTELRRQLGG